MANMPAVSLVAAPGRRRRSLELAREIERRGFSGIYSASFGDGLGFCEALALTTERIQFGTSIANIYTRNPYDYAATAALVHELSGGRFRFGIGVSHGPANERIGVQAGKPLADTRAFVEKLRAAEPQTGQLPPIVLATLRGKMVELAGEIAQGAVWANAARSHMAASLGRLPASVRGSADFFVGNMLPVCVGDDRAAAAKVLRRGLTLYLHLPNYQNYWIEAGYGEEIAAVRAAIAKGEGQSVADLMSDLWLHDVALYGSASEVREGVEAWYAAGVNTPILVPSSVSGDQSRAYEELFAAFA
jgi:alkanesulfonate monooxygenase SsuD/methylene tetrahydromethanopterin reductase-like flavin-dependent oxidoreductase (luciferase family)